MKYKVLNTEAGLGGNRLKWENCEVTAIELNEEIASNYQERFKDDKVIITDAHQYIKKYYKEYDFIWMSPTCQRNSKMIISGQNRTPDYPNLQIYERKIFLEQYYKGKFVIENVDPYYEPLIKPSLKLGRHLFWSNFKLFKFDYPKFPNFINGNDSEALKKWLGIYYEGNIYYDGNHEPSQVLRNCVHPDIGLPIFNRARNIQTQENIPQGKLIF